MDAIVDRLDRLISDRGLRWQREAHVVTVTLAKSRRKQRVHVERHGDLYLFWSTVVCSKFVTRSATHWRKLAYRAWRKNAIKDLVTFAFDEDDRLVGLIEQPAATLGHEKLELYVEQLAAECDRFEYVLTGEDLA